MMIDIEAGTYVRITREDFEEWLNTTHFHGHWRVKPGTAGIYVLPLSQFVAIELSSSLTRDDAAVSLAEASMSMKLVSLVTGQTLNKKDQGQNHFKRTLGWRQNLSKGLDRLKDAYTKAQTFYDVVATIRDREEYKRDLTSRIEAVTGWHDNDMLKSFHDRLQSNGVLTPRQVAALEAAERRATPAPTPAAAPRVDEASLQRLRELYKAVRAAGDHRAMELVESFGKQYKAKGTLSPRQVEIIEDLERRHIRKHGKVAVTLEDMWWCPF